METGSISLSPRRQPDSDYENMLHCIRCGACLPVCPTYVESLRESESPRGRVALVKGMLEGSLAKTPNLERLLYICLDCRACQTVCPTGVRIGELVVSGRVKIEEERKSQPLPRKMLRGAVFDWALAKQENLEMTIGSARIYQLLGIQRMVRSLSLLRVVPTLDIMERFLPPLPKKPLRQTLAQITPARGERKYRVGFFLGCIMSTVFAEASMATVNVLTRNGCEVFMPKDIRCCGAPFFTEGEHERPKRLARDNIDLFLSQDLDVIVTDCAACGAELKLYNELFSSDSEYAARAAEFSAKVMDISELLAQLLLANPPRGTVDKTVTYHEPCHLAHAQSVTDAPREVLQAIPGIKSVEMKKSNWCCGSAGSYTFSHREYSMSFLDDKMANAAATGADIIVSGNPGCVLQLMYGLQRTGGTAKVLYFSQLVEEAYRLGETAGASIP